jgi:hypothetical protein
MSVQDGFGWAEQAGKNSAASEEALHSKRASEAAERKLQEEISARREAEFLKRAEGLLQALSNRTVIAVTAFNRGAAAGSQILAPVRNPHDRFGFTIAKQVFVGEGQGRGPAYPGKPVQTTVEISAKERTLKIIHTHIFGEGGTIEYPKFEEKSKTQTKLLDAFALETDQSDQIVVKDGSGQTESQDSLVERICMPLFQFVK